jgi:DNA repair protein RadA/Sms
VLARHAGVGTGTADVFVNVAGGVRVDEPGADLAVALAVASAARGVVPVSGAAGREPVPLCAFGEIGLTGELRSVGHADRRLAEAGKFGLGTVITPTGSGRSATEVATLREALRSALPTAPRAKAA